MDKKLKKLLTGNCLGALLLSFILLFSFMIFLDFYTKHNEEIEIPDLSHKAYSVAAEQLAEKGIKVAVLDTGFVRNLPANVILGQSIPAGQKVKSGRELYVTINAAHATAVPIPDLANNSSYRQAEAKLTVLGFKLTATKRISGDKDWVYGIEVNGKNVLAGQKVSIDMPITLVVGDGYGDENFSDEDNVNYFVDDEEDVIIEENNDAIIDD